MAVMSPVNPFSASSKETVLEILKRDQAKFFSLVEDPKNWNVQTRCTEWEVRDLVGHMIDVTEGYFARWDIARKGEEVGTAGLKVMGETLNDHALEFRKLPREEALSRLKADKDKMLGILEGLTPQEWEGFMVMHPYMGPCPGGAYASFQIMDYGIHPYDIEYGLGDKLAELDEATAGVLVPWCHVIMQNTVEESSAAGADFGYGFEVSGPWGGKWRATVREGKWQSEPETDNFEGCDAVLRFTPSDFVLTVFGRFEGGAATGDPEVIKQVRNLFFRF
jgi:uncharacterized protein (TIGR03083 family)